MSNMDDDRTIPFQRHGAMTDAPRPRDALLATVQANVARELLLQDLVVTLETDFDAYRVATGRPEGHLAPPLALSDPDLNRLGPGNAFWVAVRDHRATVLACWFQRVWQNSSLVELINQGRLLYDGSQPPGPDRLMLFANGLDHVRGSIAFSGGGWVDPQLEGEMVPALALTLAQAKLVQDFDVDYSFSLVPAETVLSGAAATIYRYSHLDYGATLWRARPASRTELWVIHNSRADIERELALWSRDSA